MYNKDNFLALLRKKLPGVEIRLSSEEDRIYRLRVLKSEREYRVAHPVSDKGRHVKPWMFSNYESEL